MPDASAVIKKLLDYISRVDLASRTGALRPNFETAEGELIFPEDPEEQWSLYVSFGCEAPPMASIKMYAYMHNRVAGG